MVQESCEWSSRAHSYLKGGRLAGTCICPSWERPNPTVEADVRQRLEAAWETVEGGLDRAGPETPQNWPGRGEVWQAVLGRLLSSSGRFWPNTSYGSQMVASPSRPPGTAASTIGFAMEEWLGQASSFTMKGAFSGRGGAKKTWCAAREKYPALLEHNGLSSWAAPVKGDGSASQRAGPIQVPFSFCPSQLCKSP